MPRQSDAQLIAELLARYEESVRNAFLAAIEQIKSNVVLRTVIERLERGDIYGAVEAIQVDPGDFSALERAVAEAYAGGGQATVDNLPRIIGPDGNRVIWRFGVRNEPGEAWLREHSSTMVTRIVEDQRLAIRAHLEAGLAAGRNPRQTALDVVGRVSRASNRREGGIIGITAQQERYVATARAELLSGDPEQMQHYLTRGRRDRRFDRTIRKAIADGKPLDAATVDKIIGRYSSKLLELRGEMLARTETLTAMGRARDDAIGQQIRAGKVDAQDITKIWHHSHGDNARRQHFLLNGTGVPYGDVFVLADGTRMTFPHDPEAPAHQSISCRCWCQYRISFFAARLRRERAA